MQLYYAPGACSLSPHIALREAGLPFTLHKVALPAKEIEGGGDYFAVNGKGYVPALKLDNGDVLTEGAVVVQYIADQAPDSHLAPKQGTFERVRLQEWLNFIASEIHKPMGSMFNPKQTPEWRAWAETTLDKRLAWLEGKLAGHDYLTGEHFTVADGYLFNILLWAGTVKFDLSKYPNLQAFQARVAARPKVQEAMRAEGLIQ